MRRSSVVVILVNEAPLPVDVVAVTVPWTRSAVEGLVAPILRCGNPGVMTRLKGSSSLVQPMCTYFPKVVYERFYRYLVKWGRENLGCHDISPPWLSCYTEGCRQGPVLAVDRDRE